MQAKFKELHRSYDQYQQQSQVKAEQKKQIKSMEEEKQQLNSKISKLFKKVEQINNHRQWLEAARRLRIEQNQEFDVLDKLNEQKQNLYSIEQRIAEAQYRQKEIRSNLGVSPEALLQKLRDDIQMNIYMATQKLPKIMEEKHYEIQEMKELLRRPVPSSKDIQLLEQQVIERGSMMATSMDQKIVGEDDRLNVFKQQAAMISRKKDAAADQLKSLMEEQSSLSKLVEQKKSNVAYNSKIPKGEELKNYINAVRNKAAVYKEKKRLLSELSAELGVLQRTQEILKRDLDEIREVTRSQDQLLDLGVADSPMPLKKKLSGSSYEDISKSASKLEEAIHTKKEQLTPQIRDLRELRQRVQELEHHHQEKKKQYDATMMGLDTEVVTLEQNLRLKKSHVNDLESKIFQAQASFGIWKVNAERVASEMKVYVGGDEQLEALQKQRGFKTYRDLYQKKINELEISTKQLREQSNSIAVKYEPSIRQQEMFKDILKLLQTKSDVFQKQLKARQNSAKETKQESVPDRLVL